MTGSSGNSDSLLEVMYWILLTALAGPPALAQTSGAPVPQPDHRFQNQASNEMGSCPINTVPSTPGPSPQFPRVQQPTDRYVGSVSGFGAQFLIPPVESLITHPTAELPGVHEGHSSMPAAQGEVIFAGESCQMPMTNLLPNQSLVYVVTYIPVFVHHPTTVSTSARTGKLTVRLPRNQDCRLRINDSVYSNLPEEVAFTTQFATHAKEQYEISAEMYDGEKWVRLQASSIHSQEHGIGIWIGAGDEVVFEFKQLP